MKNKTLLLSRWRGGPPICAVENLPAFESKEALLAHKANQYPSVITVEIWRCRACRMWHHYGVGPDPAGSTSGTTRSQKHTPPRRLKFWEREDSADGKLLLRDLRR